MNLCAIHTGCSVCAGIVKKFTKNDNCVILKEVNIMITQNLSSTRPKTFMDYELAKFHQNTREPNEKPHIKYVSPDGKREVIFDYTGTKVISADEDVGTYNYADPELWLAHFFADILPWIRYGNTPEDPTEWYERIGGSFDFEK